MNNQKSRTVVCRSAFTLTELLVFIASIVLVGGLILPSIAKARKSYTRKLCRENLIKLGEGSFAFANDHNSELTGCPNLRSDDLNWLNGTYISTPRTFVCAGTRNTIRTNEIDAINSVTKIAILKDLQMFAPTKWEKYGHSFEQLGYWRTGQVKTLQLVNTYTNNHPNNPFGLFGRLPGPANIWLMMDSDNVQLPPSPPNFNDYPDVVDHHGADGANVLFADGHAEFILQKDFVYRRELGLDQGKLEP